MLLQQNLEKSEFENKKQHVYCLASTHHPTLDPQEVFSQVLMEI